MQINNEKLVSILLSGNYITKEEIAESEEIAKSRRIDLIDVLIQKELLTKDIFGQAIAEFHNVPYADLNSHKPTKDKVLKIPEKIAKKYNVVLHDEGPEEVVVATNEPSNKELGISLKEIFKGKKITTAYSLEEDIKEGFKFYKKPLETRINKIIEKSEHVAPDILDEIVKEAISVQASDIHLEPQDKKVIVRLRIDGKLREFIRLEPAQYESLTNLIKVKARLQIDEHQSAQDGAIRYENKEVVSDLRVSIAPVLDGEKIVIRLLTQYIKHISLSDLGLGEENQKLLNERSKKPFGMILVTGPTGAGKTTTLYGVMKELNSPDINIATIEDPVEYKIPGVNHIQVNQKTNLTFAKGLRSIVRQDPDVILVGEIRDQETAEIAVNAALTGHMLLSTFHSNDAATAIPRLLDMGIEPFLLSSTLELVMAQRLVRMICDECKTSYQPSLEELQNNLGQAVNHYFPDKNIRLYRGSGCNACGDSGYRGRMAIYEMIAVSESMRDLILTNPSTQQVNAQAKKDGARPLFEDGMEKVLKGVTTLEELKRVAMVPNISYEEEKNYKQ